MAQEIRKNWNWSRINKLSDEELRVELEKEEQGQDTTIIRKRNERKRTPKKEASSSFTRNICDICDKELSTRWNLERHMSEAHSGKLQAKSVANPGTTFSHSSVIEARKLVKGFIKLAIVSRVSPI